MAIKGAGGVMKKQGKEIAFTYTANGGPRVQMMPPPVAKNRMHRPNPTNLRDEGGEYVGVPRVTSVA